MFDCLNVLVRGGKIPQFLFYPRHAGLNVGLADAQHLPYLGLFAAVEV